ncbi:uncharacterized protein CLUP02_03369 [Colletotrichum lupini]|uniref:Uncharacterized protein n=1 Tax=Colletotrichum lupini TaxID=145971 RepID=A0A9Q8SIC9_9PEZI|nr:uncharacterized protein CLUP02_03369 [Colletotrichum lupini]UQC77896.1 hypothetical protein CLUP02_03369 [Colletotrichum lupini]
MATKRIIEVTSWSRPDPNLNNTPGPLDRKTRISRCSLKSIANRYYRWHPENQFASNHLKISSSLTSTRSCAVTAIPQPKRLMAITNTPFKKRQNSRPGFHEKPFTTTRLAFKKVFIVQYGPDQHALYEVSE